MVRPVCFAFNEETATNNSFQQRVADADATRNDALREFDTFVALLRANGISVDVLQDTPEPFTPDSIFPNNCFSTHTGPEGRTLVWYPMYAHNRRWERTKLKSVLEGMSFDRVIDLTPWELEGKFLEGTGSLVLDRVHRMAYACRSPRTDELVLQAWASAMHYDYCLFDAVDSNGHAVYHTNVVMHVGTCTAVVCIDSIHNGEQRSCVIDTLEASGKQVVPITQEQMAHFAGNMLELHNAEGRPILVMSATARRSLTSAQVDMLERHTQIIAPEIHAIETAGGGSARCMMAEIEGS